MEEFIVNLLAVMVLLNFILNLTSVYLGRYKKQLLDEKLDHILDHLCPAYQLDEDNIYKCITQPMKQRLQNFLKNFLKTVLILKSGITWRNLPMRTKYIEIQIAYESDEDFEAIILALKELLPKNQSQIIVEQGFDKPNGWMGFNDKSV